MGYTHYWYRDREIASKPFAKISDDFRKLLPLFKASDVKLGNGMGEGNPVINHNEVVFNGLRNCGHPKNSHIVVPWPASTVKPNVAPNSSQAVVGSWFAGVVLNQRTCNGDCSYETFYFPRVLPQLYKPVEPVTYYDLSGHQVCNGKLLVGKYFDFCKTAFRPYDLAVTAFLVIAKQYLSERILVRSDGTMMHWMDAVKLCQNVLGYGLGFQLGERSIEKASYA
jgi:hypothetical protein